MSKTKLGFSNPPIRCGKWRKQDKTMAWSNGHVWLMSKTILNYHDWLDWLSSVMKREKNGVTNRTGVVYVEINIKLSWPIGSSTYCDENQIGQLHDWLCKYTLYRNWNWATVINIETYLTVCNLWWKQYRTTMWPINLGVLYDKN